MRHIVTRREFVRGCGNAVVASAFVAGCGREATQSPATPFIVEEADLAGMQAAMLAGSLTARRLCELYLERIEQLNPRLRAIIETNPDALSIADRLDRERRGRRVLGPLHGIPIAVKDTIETGDRMQTAGGSVALVDVPTQGDAFVVECLRGAGAIILAKTNLTEWGGPGARMGWSSRGGQTHNPYALERSPLGSSSGSGSAVAANLVAAAVGAETIGSIIGPSSVMGLVGMKPTAGRVSRRGTMPNVPTSDTIGPMTRTVRDAAILLTVMAAQDPADVPSVAPVHETPRDYVSSLDPNGLRGVRLGVLKTSASDLPALPVFAQAIEDLRGLGAQVIENIPVPSIERDFGAKFERWFYGQIKHSYETYFRERRPNTRIRTVDDIMAFNERTASDSLPLPYLGQRTFEQIRPLGPISEKSFLDAREYIVGMVRSQGVEALLAKHELDAFVSFFGPAGDMDAVPPMPYLVGAAGLAGSPVLTVPMGQVSGLPVGLQFFGAPWSEASLLRYGFAYEQHTRHRKPPPALA